MKTTALRIAKLSSRRRTVLQARVAKYTAKREALTKAITELLTEIKELDAIIHRHLLAADSAAAPVKVDPLEEKRERYRNFTQAEYAALEGSEKEKFDWDYYRTMGHYPRPDELRSTFATSPDLSKTGS